MSRGLELAYHWFEHEQFEKCMDALTEAADGALGEALFWYLRAECLRRLGRPDDAIETAQAALSQWPEDVGLLDSLGLSLMASGDIEAGDDAFRSALSIAPGEAGLLAHHAVALAKLGSLDEAQRAVDALMIADPGWIGALETRAQVACIGDHSAADGYVADLLGCDPENRLGHVLRGNLALRRRQARPAADAFGDAAALNPSNVSIARAARETRIAAHPLLAPARPLFMLGRRRTRAIGFAVAAFLVLLGNTPLKYALAALWIALMIVVPRGLRLYYRWQHGSI